MSKRVFDPAPGTPAMTKAEKRDAAKVARARLAAAARRRALAKQALIGVVVTGIIIAAFFWLKDSFTAAPSAAPSTDPTATSTANPPAAFPPVPAGANEALKTKPVVEPPTGAVPSLKVTTLIEGTGAAAENGKQLTVNYVGVSFKDGKEFDASWNKSQTLPFTLGQGGVIVGWDEGLLGVKVGSRVQIDIPADKAYGENPTDGRPGGALRFVVDVLAVG